VKNQLSCPIAAETTKTSSAHQAQRILQIEKYAINRIKSHCCVVDTTAVQYVNWPNVSCSQSAASVWPMMQPQRLQQTTTVSINKYNNDLQHSGQGVGVFTQENREPLQNAALAALNDGLLSSRHSLEIAARYRNAATRSQSR